MLKTVVEERGGVAPGTPEEVHARVAAAIPKAHEMAHEGDLTRIAAPLGRTGLQHIVVDLVVGSPAGTPAAPTTPVRLRAYGKEGLLSRKPTATTADKVGGCYRLMKVGGSAARTTQSATSRSARPQASPPLVASDSADGVRFWPFGR